MAGWTVVLAVILTAVVAVTHAGAAQLPDGKTYTNAIGMEFVRIEPGSFTMGVGQTPLPDETAGQPWRGHGHFDERPNHPVTITKPFYTGVYEVTNAQYEQFDPDHRAARGKLGFSNDDDEAVVFVSWHDAVAFCGWLSEKEGLPYRLPTEAEWEYACRAGTATPYWTGDTLPVEFHKNPQISWFPDPDRARGDVVVPMKVGQTPPNPWGLYDVHGNVEEWCEDWYGPYEEGPQTDPVGRVDGDFRVARGGSHSTELFYLRSAARMGTLPDDKSWLIGFRVVLGPAPTTEPLPVPPPERHRQDMRQDVPADIAEGPDPAVPYFKGPRTYVKISDGANGPMFAHHNHDPALVDCPNGDLLAIWYSCVQEPGRELCLLASRLRYGAEEWEPASPFWDAPNRNDHGPAMWFDGDQTIYQFVGLSAAATWGNLATIMRTSTDSGATWSKARIINPEHRTRQMPVESVFRTGEGVIVLPCDAVTGGNGGTATYLSDDNGETWRDPGSQAAGIHAGVVQLGDGRLMALGCGDNVEGRMPMSLSADMGKTWTRTPSPFQPIGGGQRLVLTRLREGPLFFASFAKKAFTFTDAADNEREGRGLFCTASLDDGKTWTQWRPVTDDGRGRIVRTTDGARVFMDGDHGEPRGYFSVCQTTDGLIQLIGSRQHYTFNLAWVTTPPPPPPPFLDNGVTAHRGCSIEFPGNTMPAFEAALFSGADFIELDVLKTSDGKLVVIHDATTGRVGDVSLLVAKSTYEQLQAVDVAHAFRKERGLTLEQCPKATIPLLSDVLRLVKKYRRARVSIQPKADIVDDCIEEIRRLEAHDWVGFNEGSLERAKRVKKLEPGIPVFWDRPGNAPIEKDIATARKHGFETLVLNHTGVTKEKVDALHAAGLEAGAWTVNDPAVMANLLALGVDRIYTDDPAILLAVKDQDP